MYEKKRTSGWTVFIAFIIFAPLGFFFLHKRLTEDKSESLRNSKIVKIFAWTLISFFIIYLYALFTTDNKLEGILIALGLSSLFF